MTRPTIVVTTLVLAAGLVAGLPAEAPAAQERGRGQAPAPPPQGDPVILDLTKPQHDKTLTLDIVEVVGCVSEGPNNAWVLINGSDPVKGGTPSTTAEALKTNASKPLGAQRYVLIGASEWNPSSHKGQKVAVKGLLIKDVNETRLNVTSFNKVGETCTK